VSGRAERVTRESWHADPRAAGRGADGVDGDRILDVLESLLAEKFVADANNPPHLLEDRAGEADAPSLCDLFETCSDINCSAAGAPLLHYELPRIEADPKYDPQVCRKPGVPFAAVGLNAQAAFECLDGARELGHQAVAGKAEYSAVRPLDLAAKAVEFGSDPVVRLLLVALHQCAVAHDVCAENCGQPPLHSLPLGSAPGRGQSVVSQHHRYFCVRVPPRQIAPVGSSTEPWPANLRVGRDGQQHRPRIRDGATCDPLTCG